MNAAAVIALLLGLLDRAASIGALLGIMQTEGRDATPAEWAALLSADAAARAALVAAIAAAKGQAPAATAKKP